MVSYVECKTADEARLAAKMVMQKRRTIFAPQSGEKRELHFKDITLSANITCHWMPTLRPAATVSTINISPVEEIRRAVCAALNIPKSALESSRRGKSEVTARHICFVLCREFTSLSLPQIARKFGNRDHTTILHGIRKMKKRRDLAAPLLGPDASIREWVEKLVSIINHEPKNPIHSNTFRNLKKAWDKQKENNGQTAQEAKTSEAS